MTNAQWINMPEWDEGQRHWDAFWQGELIDRPAALLTAPSGQDGPPAPEPPDGETKYGDPEFALRVNDVELPKRIYLCEALPTSRMLHARSGDCLHSSSIRWTRVSVSGLGTSTAGVTSNSSEKNSRVPSR